MEQRSSPRFPVGFPIAFQGDQVVGTGRVVNLSTGGCGIECDKIVQKGTFLDLRVHIAGRQEPILQVDLAAVRWSSGKRFGVEFLRIRSEEQSNLSQLVRAAMRQKQVAVSVR